MQSRGRFHDGETAARREVSFEIDAAAGLLKISAEDGLTPVTWRLADLLEARDHGWGKALVVYPEGNDARLVISGVYEVRHMRLAAPNMRRTVIDSTKLRRVFKWAVGAVAALALLLFVILPGLADQLARWIPPEREAAFGRGLLTQFARLLTDTEDDDGLCPDPVADAALAGLAARLTGPTDLPYDIEIHIMNHPMVNAFALPGGQIVLMRGLIDEAADGQEVAAVLAHEIGHVVARDPTRIALRAAGSAGLLGLFFGDFAGGSVAAVLSEQLMQASYTREAETAADAFGHAALARANLPPEAMARFFERLRAEFGDADGPVAAFLSHPRLTDRIAAAEAADGGVAEARAFSDDDWAALRRICRDGDTAKP